MEHSKQVEILTELIRQVGERVNVDAGVVLRNPTSVYVSSELANVEWETFFQRHPQVLGLSLDLSLIHI